MTHEHHHGSCSEGSCSQHQHSHVCDCCGMHHCECECHALHHHHQKYADQLIAIADEAWMEILKEKIKDQIRKTSAEHLDAMAKIVADANHLRWKHKMETRKVLEDYENHLEDLLRHDQRKK